MTQSYQFSPTASTNVTGYLQSVSKDGSIVIYGTYDKYYMYYYNGRSIHKRSFETSPEFVTTSEKYDENSPFNHVLATLINETIVVYIVSINKQAVTMVEIGSFGKGQISFKKEEFAWEILDADIHPISGCLALLNLNSIWLVFQSQAENYQISYPPTGIQILDGKLLIISSDSTINYYQFYIQRQPEEQDLQVHKIQQLSRGESYDRVDFNFFFLKHSNNVIKYLQYDPVQKIFATTVEHLFGEELQTGTVFMNDDLHGLDVQGDVTSYSFICFLPGEDKVVVGNYHFTAVTSQLYQICVIPYIATSALFKYQADEQRCVDGYIDHVGVWQRDDQAHIVTQVDQKLIIYNKSVEEKLTQLNVDTFSTKSQNLLITSTCGNLQYNKWAPKEISSTNQSTVEVGMIVGLCVLGVISVVLIVLLVKLYLIPKIQQQNQEKNSEKMPVHMDSNPYLNKQDDVSTPKPPKMKQQRPKSKKKKAAESERKASFSKSTGRQ